MDVNGKEPRNPGPSWSFALFRFGVRVLPLSLQYAGGWIGASVAYWRMPAQRNHSRAYLEAILQRPPLRREVWKHFYTFTLYLIAKVRAGVGKPVELVCEGSDREHAEILFGNDPMLLGTFHVGASDLLGFHIGETGRRVCMVRMRVGNSGDLDALAHSLGDAVRFIWVNDPGQLLLSLGEALRSSDTIAMQCDRIDHTGRKEVFDFLGKPRIFRTSIYRLAWLFKRKVIFCVAVRDKGIHRFRIRVYPAFDGSGLDKKAHHMAAHRHFQGVLTWLDGLLKENPYLWFNFLPLNPEVTSENEGGRR